MLDYAGAKSLRSETYLTSPEVLRFSVQAEAVIPILVILYQNAPSLSSVLPQLSYSMNSTMMPLLFPAP